MSYESDPYRFSFKDYYEHKARCDQEIRHIRKQSAQDQKHHDEMMALIEKLKHVKQQYAELWNINAQNSAAYNTMLDVVEEHLHEMNITKEEIDDRVASAMSAAVKE